MRLICTFIFFCLIFATSCWANHTMQNNAEKQAIEKAALSFYEWYLPTVHKLDNENYPFTVRLIEDDDGKFKLDYTIYFNELGKLGSISNKFLQAEKDRFSYSEKYLNSDEIETYYDAYNELVDDFYYYRMSQDIDFESAKIVSIQINPDEQTACVEIMLTTTESEEYVGIGPHAQMLLEKENNSWMITKITPLI